MPAIPSSLMIFMVSMLFSVLVISAISCSSARCRSMVGRVSRAYLRRSWSSPAWAWARYSATERSCPAIISAVHFASKSLLAVPDGGGAAALRSRNRPMLVFGDLRQARIRAAVVVHQHLGDAFQFGLLQLRQRFLRGIDFLVAALGGFLHEGDVVDRLADLRCRRSTVRRPYCVWLACMSAAMSGTSEALPAVRLSPAPGMRASARHRASAAPGPRPED